MEFNGLRSRVYKESELFGSLVLFQPALRLSWAVDQRVERYLLLYITLHKGAFLWENPNPDSCIQKRILRFFT